MRMAWARHGRFLTALLLAAMVHAVLILCLRFHLPKPKEMDQSLDVVLVLNPTPKPPVTAEFVAPLAQQGGGMAKEKALPKSAPIPLATLQPKQTAPRPMPKPRKAIERQPVNPPPPVEKLREPEPVAEEKPVAADPPVQPAKPLAEEQPPAEEKALTEGGRIAEETQASETSEPEPVLWQAKADKKVAAPARKKGRVEPSPAPPHLTAELLSQQIAEVTTEFNRSREDQAKQQRMVYINSVNAHKYHAAAYEAAWQEKVERLGNLNYPEEARRKNLSGSLLLAVGINADGSIYSIKVRQSSGEAVLDEAAQQIVRLAAPFAPFPKELLGEADVLVITRTWRFSIDNRVETGQ